MGKSETVCATLTQILMPGREALQLVISGLGFAAYGGLPVG